MKKYKAIISDIDGTLAPLAFHAVVSDPVKKAIHSLAKKHIAFSVATGKPFYLIEHLIDELKLESPVIVDNGTAIFDAKTKKAIWISVMDRRKIDIIFSIAKKHKIRVKVTSGKNGYDIRGSIPSHLKIQKVRFIGVAVNQVNTCIREIESVLKDISVTRASAYEGEGFLDLYVTNAEATKLHAVVKTAEILGISTKQIIGVGDHYNDFPLLMACGLKVAMGNAVEDLKAIADYIAPSVEDDGMVDIIKKFF